MCAFGNRSVLWETGLFTERGKEERKSLTLSRWQNSHGEYFKCYQLAPISSNQVLSLQACGQLKGSQQYDPHRALVQDTSTHLFGVCFPPWCFKGRYLSRTPAETHAQVTKFHSCGGLQHPWREELQGDWWGRGTLRLKSDTTRDATRRGDLRLECQRNHNSVVVQSYNFQLCIDDGCLLTRAKNAECFKGIA